MELTAQCDHLNIQLRRKKNLKNVNNINGNTSGKKNGIDDSPNGVFGINLEALLSKDKRITGDNLLEVPIAFEKVCFSLISYSSFVRVSHASAVFLIIYTCNGRI